MATNLPSCSLIQFLEQLLKFLINCTLLKYVKSQRSYGFLITKELAFGFKILDLKDHFSASLRERIFFLWNHEGLINPKTSDFKFYVQIFDIILVDFNTFYLPCCLFIPFIIC